MASRRSRQAPTASVGFGGWESVAEGYGEGIECWFRAASALTGGVEDHDRHALVNGWYYNATRIPSPTLLARVLWHSRGRAVKILYNALIRVSRDPSGS